MKNLLVAFFLLYVVLQFYGCGKNPQDRIIIGEQTSKNIQCEYFNLTGLGFTNLPDFDTLISSGVISVSELNEVDSNNSIPFSFLNITENFGLRCEAIVEIKTAGSVKFLVVSDDGSKLFVNGSLLISNDGSHAMTLKTANKTLAVGKHKIKLEYFNGTGNKGLQLAWRLPGSSIDVIIPKESFVK